MARIVRVLYQLVFFTLLSVILATPRSFSAGIDSLQRLAIPPVTRYTPNVDAYPRNHAIAQDSKGNIYVGNTDGLLIFNGETWQHLPLPNGKLVRSLAAGAGQRVYVGGYDDFGYIEPDASGQITFHSLSTDYQQIRATGFADIWDLLITTDAVYFRAVNDLFRYDLETGDIKLWQHEARFGAMLQDNNEVYVQFRGEGIKRYQEDDFVPYLLSPELQLQIYRFIQIDSQHWLANRRDGVWLEIKHNQVQPLLFANLPASNAFFDISLIQPGVIAMAGKDGAIHILEWATGKVSRFEISHDVLLAISAASQGGIVALTNQHVIHLAWPAQWQSIDAKYGLRGNIYDITLWQDQWYLMGSAGAFTLPSVLPDNGFTKLNWTHHEAWDLLPLNAEQALFADSYSLYLLEGQHVDPISHNALYPRELVASVFKPETILIATELGIAVLRTPGQDQAATFTLEWTGLGTLVNSMVEMDAGEIWLGTATRGVVRLKLNAEYSQLKQVDYFDASHGIAYDHKGEAKLAKIDDQLIVSSVQGLFRYNGTDFEPWDSALDTLRFAGQVLTLTQNAAQETWAYSYNRLYYKATDSWQEIDTIDVGQGPLNSHWLASSPWIFGANSTLFLYQPQTVAASQPAFNLILQQVKTGKESDLVAVDLEPDTALTVRDNHYVIFDFVLPGLYPLDTTLYRARLAGFEAHFSEWNRSRKISYYQLAPGKYQFEAEARDYLGNISAITPFQIVVPYPWYLTWQAKLFWLLLTLSTLWLLMRYLVRLRTQVLYKDRQRLRSMVEEHTRELATANRKLESMANMDGLTGIANRRRLDSYLLQTAKEFQQQNRPLALLLIDVDFFKQFNDLHGHVKGDEVLQAVATTLGKSLRRREDLLARYGGEEFTVVLQGSDDNEALQVAEQMRQQVEQSSAAVTISIGVAWTSGSTTIDTQQLLRQADKALYQAKAAGRNRVKLFEADVASTDQR